MIDDDNHDAGAREGAGREAVTHGLSFPSHSATQNPSLVWFCFVWEGTTTQPLFSHSKE